MTVAQLLYDFIKHAVVHFAPFLTPFLLVLAFCVFKKTKFVDFSHLREIYEEVWKET